MTDKTVASRKGETPASAGGAANTWYAVSPDDVAQRLGVDSSNAVGNFCFEVSLSYRRAERPRRVTGSL